MTVKQRVLERLQPDPTQIDREWHAWCQQPECMIAILRQPILGIQPSLRTIDERRTLLIEKIKRDWKCK